MREPAHALTPQVTAGLVAPKPNVFRDDVRHVLVLATAVEIVLLGVSFGRLTTTTSTTTTTAAASPPPPTSTIITFLPTSMSLSTDNVTMVHIDGTAAGRIFTCGRDGCIYEIDYSVCLINA
jgi:nuclear pore complex protein Nup155